MYGLKDISRALPEAQIIGPGVRSFKRIVIDSRIAGKGDLFIPIKGAKFDGSDFIPEVLKKGASVLETDNGLQALQQLAAYWRGKFKVTVIGVTGSVGKTTTKDMIAAVLSRKMKTLKNEENFNNEIGVPLTLLRLGKNHKAAVIEMGMQGPGEIELLSRLARPAVAVVTNIGEAHLEFLKTKKNIANAKAEIFRHVARGGWAVINQDDEFYENLKVRITDYGLRFTTFGILEKADITPKALEGIELPIPGQHNIYNALAAAAVAKIMKIGRKELKKGLEKFTPSSKRMEVIIRKRDGVKIINDTYNANPQSMGASLETIGGMEGRRIAVMG
ncbi:MAG TPA: UDP-N-acetylmuramoyl-tripeptide--D-alanyl-D-alanine ligase, partial [Candidatus Omnitrophota bacterium]|nr:UDP-N-acetylmuramoyl-tripeptide--D-alanyl-D-alanine ligase [Candidatus Omnitrophota bacterium]